MGDAKLTNGNFGNFLVELEKQGEEARTTIKAMLSLPNTSQDTWRGMLAVPPGSALERLLSVFRQKTDIPLEIPFFCFLHFLSGWLLKQKVKISGGGVQDLYPDLWTIVLAPSGSGKTIAHDFIGKAAPVKSTFPEPNSGAKFIQDLQQNNFSLWFQDEIAQKLKQIETPNSPLADVKEYLLRAYSYGKIERSTVKSGIITVDEPCLGILGLNTHESFSKALSQESLTDGFAQRFCYVIAEKDPERSIEDYPIYDAKRLTAAAKFAFDKVLAVPLHKEYKLGHEAVTAFKTSFGMMFSEGIPPSFYRRVMFRSFKYALLYHLITGKSSDTLDAEDIGWAARLSALHLQDVKKLLNVKRLEGIAGLLNKARAIKQKVESQGKEVKARDIRNGIHGIDTNEQAEAILSMLRNQ